MTLGEKLQRLRKARGMSQEELAARMGVSRQAVSRWELNIALPDTENVVRLSELVGVTTAYLLKEREAEENPSPDTPPSSGAAAFGWPSPGWVCWLWGF